MSAGGPGPTRAGVSLGTLVSEGPSDEGDDWGWSGFVGCLETSCERWPTGIPADPQRPPSLLRSCFPGRLGVGSGAGVPRSSHFIS